MFDDVTLQRGLAGPTFAFTGFGTRWFDYDNDGFLDLFIANGAVTIVESMRAAGTRTNRKTSCFIMGVRSKVSGDKSPRRTSLAAFEVGRGAVFGDIDNDGAVDILVTNNNRPFRLLRNQIGSQQHWLRCGWRE